MPGGAEALVHTRETIEGATRSDPSCGVWATVDADFHYAFPSLRYEAIDAAVGSRILRVKTMVTMVSRSLQSRLPAIWREI